MRFRCFAFFFLLAGSCWSQSIPRSLQGRWRVTAVLPTHTGCWAGRKASRLLHTTITYTPSQIRWAGVSYAITDTFPRTLTPEQFRSESSSSGHPLELTALGIRTPSVTELDLQHDDVDITDVTTEIPGDTVLLAGPNRIVVTVCGTYFEASRGSSGGAATRQRTVPHTVQRTSNSRRTARRSGF